MNPDVARMKQIALTLLLSVALLAWGAVGACAGQFDDGLAAYDQADYATALTLWRPLAAQGIADAQDGLGVMYKNGQGVAQDYDKAVSWFRRAAEQGNTDAQNNLGLMYENGLGVTQDYDKAVKWFALAAE